MARLFSHLSAAAIALGMVAVVMGVFAAGG
jgi:flagellar motor component MotA